MTRRVAVLLHEAQRERDMRRYVIGHMARFWRDDGIDVVFVSGTKRFVPADVLFVHVDLSVVPDDYLEYARAYPVTINGGVKDIRKSAFSTNLVRRGDGYEGPVVVKSNLNQRGRPERNLARPRLVRMALRSALITRAARWLGGRVLSADEYAVYDCLADVPDQILRRSDLVVERFVPEFSDGLYHVRHFDFLGDNYVSFRFSSPEPVVRDAGMVTATKIEPHPALFELKTGLRLDYGKLDYVISNGEIVLLDVNKTTGVATLALADEVTTDRRRHRAKGIYSFLDATTS